MENVIQLLPTQADELSAISDSKIDWFLAYLMDEPG